MTLMIRRLKPLSWLHTSNFFAWQVSLTMFICSCVWTKNFLLRVFPWQVFFAGVYELTSFHCSQQYNYTAGHNFVFWSWLKLIVWWEKKGCWIVDWVVVGLQRRGATLRQRQSQGFASNFVQELWKEDGGSFHNFFQSVQYYILNILDNRRMRRCISMGYLVGVNETYLYVTSPRPAFSRANVQGIAEINSNWD